MLQSMPCRSRTAASIAECQAWSSGDKAADPPPLEQHGHVQLTWLRTVGRGDGGVHLDQVRQGHPIGLERHIIDGDE